MFGGRVSFLEEGRVVMIIVVHVDIFLLVGGKNVTSLVGI